MKKILLLASVAVALLMSCVTLAASSASLQFSGAQSTYTLSQHVIVNVLVNPNGATYDTVRTDITFPANLLSVQRVAINPAFSIASPENSYNNDLGTISYGAGIPGGNDKPATFATITFGIKKTGNATVTIDPASLVLANGENIFSGKSSQISFNIIPGGKPTSSVMAAALPSASPTPSPSATDQEALAAAAIPIVNATPANSNAILWGLAPWILGFLALLAILWLIFSRNKKSEKSQKP